MSRFTESGHEPLVNDSPPAQGKSSLSLIDNLGPGLSVDRFSIHCSGSRCCVAHVSGGGTLPAGHGQIRRICTWIAGKEFTTGPGQSLKLSPSLILKGRPSNLERPCGATSSQRVARASCWGLHTVLATVLVYNSSLRVVSSLHMACSGTTPHATHSETCVERKAH